MRHYSAGELLYPLVCLVVLSSVESFNWTAQPTNPTLAIKGQDLSLAWQFSLTADEQRQSQSQFSIRFSKKLNQSASNYDVVAVKSLSPLTGPAIIYAEPQAPHIVIDRDDQATLHIKDVRREDEGTYKIEYILESDGTVLAEQRVNLTVLERTELDYTSKDKDVCEDSKVTLFCNATGKPVPSINWTRVWENGTDDEQLPVVGGRYVISSIKRSSNGTYRCTAYNGVGDPVNHTVKVIVRYSASVVRVVNSSDTVIEGNTFNMTCEVSGDPTPNVTWITVSNYEHSYGNTLNFTNIMRGDSGDYRCETKNRCGKESRNESINVFYQPENARLITNASSRVCTGVVINFTCTADANPAVHTYLLYENDSVVKSMGISGTWIKSLENPGKFVFRCEANNSIQGIGKSGNTTLTVDVPAAVEKIENKVVKEEGDNLRVYCNVTAGILDPTVMWTKVTSGEHIKGNPLNITNISRAQAGKYRCTANNTCGVDSTVVDIDVQYQPDMVTLETNTTENKDCSDMWVNFTCISSEANPPVYNYLLSDEKNGFSFSKSGTWIKKISRGGKSIYNCTAYQLVGNVTSTNNITLTVNVPASVEQVENILNITEGENVEEYCNVTAAFPHPTVVWINVTTGEDIKENLLNITNINRTQAGEYKCIANNTCGEASTMMNINVQYPPDIVDISVNQTVNESDPVVLNCTAVANPTASITWTRVSDNSPVSFPLNITGKQDEGGYRCTAENSIQDPAGKTTYISVENYHPIEPKLNISVNTVTLNKTFNITCSAQANPAAKYRFYKHQEYVFNDTSGKDVAVFPTLVRERVLKVNYSCTPFNKFGDGPTEVISVSVLFAPFVTDGNPTQKNCPISCPVNGNPLHNFTWYKGNDSSTKISNVNTKQLPESVCNSGLYTCFTENHLGNVTVTVKVVIVENPVPTTSSIPTTKENPVPTTSSIPTTKESTMHVRMKINASCDQKSDVEKKVPRLACQVTKPMGCVTAKALDSRPGCVILDFEMKFNQSVVVGEVLNVLKTAAKNDSFAGFQVDPKSIAQISPPTTGTSSTKESGCSGFFRNEDCKIKLVLVIVIAVAGLMVICIIVGVIAWWVHKRRKCRKDTRVHHSTSEEQPFSRANSTPGDDNSNSQVNNGYAEAGPLPSKMTDTAQHLGASSPAAVPTYAVVDKSAKKGKKKDKNVEEQKPQAEPPQYSVVDKSKKKKKKKEEPEATYAQVDMSKKSKKKPKAGEVLYADLGDFHQMQELPNVSTSPKALPPIKKPEAYVETQYADITQFLKGDVTLPDSSNSQGPAGGTQAAAVPENQESQEPGTSAKETSKASNPGGDGGPDHETNF